MNAFGAVLRDIRATHGLSQHALAERMGLATVLVVDADGVLHSTPAMAARLIDVGAGDDAGG